MKEELNLMIVFLILFVAYIFMLLFLGEIQKNWFSVALFFLSLYLAVKAYFFRSDSSLFGAVLALLASIIFCENFALYQNTFQLGSLLNMAVAIAFFVDFLIFHSKFTFYSFLTNFLISFPIFLYAFYCINLLLMILLLCGAVLLSFVAILAKKYGKI